MNRARKYLIPLFIAFFLLALATPAFLQPVTGTWTPYGWLFKSAVGDKGPALKTSVDTGLTQVDARLAKQIWTGDPAIAAAIGAPVVEYITALESAITAIGSTPCTLHIPTGTNTFNASVTIPANIEIVPERGALFILGNYNLYINGPFRAGPYKVFSYTGTGAVSFGPGAVTEVFSEWWGAIGNGTADDTTPVWAAKYASEGNGFTLRFLPGKTYAISWLQIAAGNWAVNARGAKILHNGSTANSVSGFNDLIVACPTNPLTSGSMDNFRWDGGLLVAKQSATNPTHALLFCARFWHSQFTFEGFQCGNSWDTPTTNYSSYGIYVQGYIAGGSTGTYYDDFWPGHITGATSAGIYIYCYGGNLNANNLNFWGGRIKFCQVGVDIQAGQGNNFYGFEIEDCTSYGLIIESAAKTDGFYGGWLEANNSNGQQMSILCSDNSFSFTGTLSTQPDAATISACQYLNTNWGVKPLIIDLPFTPTISSGAVTLPGGYSFYKINLNANVTSITFPASPADVTPIKVRFFQGAGGPYTVSGWPSNVRFPGGSFTVTPTVGKSDCITFEYDQYTGYWLAIAITQNVG